MSRTPTYIAATGAVIVMISASPGFAQRLPSSAQPGRLEHRFEQPVGPQSRPEVEFPAPEQAPPPDKAGGIHFTLKDLRLEGGTLYTTDELRPLYADLLGHEISLLDLYKLRDAITAKYRSAGYVLSLAVIPAQHIAGGVARLALVEGYVNTVHIEGPYKGEAGLLKGYAERIRASRPLRASVLERYVMLMDDLPGISVHTALKAAKTTDPGSDLTVTVERKPVGVSLDLDNRGSASVGPLQLNASVNLNDQLGLFDQTSVRGILTPRAEELRYLDIAHTEPLGGDGATWVFGLRRSWSLPGADVRQYDIASVSSTLHAGVAYPLIRSRSETLRLTGDLTLRNSATRENGAPLSTDRTREIAVGANLDVTDGWQGSNLIQLGVTRSLDSLGAVAYDASRLDTQLLFTKVSVTAQRVQPLPAHFSLLAGVDSQYSPNKLVSAEQFGVGGKTYGRDFDSSAITGDKGFAIKGELQYTPTWEIPHLKYTQLYLFSDYGRTWNHVDAFPTTYQYIASNGGGFRFGVGERVNGSVEVCAPISYHTATNEDPGIRAFFTLSAAY